MNEMDAFDSALRLGASSLGVQLSMEAREQLATYQQVLARWAPKVNLVADPDPALTVGVHFLDSVALNRILPDGNIPLADIGTGAGFPGLVQAILHPERQVTLIEPIGKRASFLQQVIIAAKIKNCQVEIARTSQCASQSNRILVARAVFPPKQWLQEATRLLDGAGWIVLMTSTSPPQDARESAENLKLTPITSDSFQLPVADAPRVNTLYQLGNP